MVSFHPRHTPSPILSRYRSVPGPASPAQGSPCIMSARRMPTGVTRIFLLTLLPLHGTRGIRTADVPDGGVRGTKSSVGDEALCVLLGHLDGLASVFVGEQAPDAPTASGPQEASLPLAELALFL